MRYSSHRVAGICVGLSAASIISGGDIDTSTLAMAETVVISSMIGAILPDIDEPNSFVSKHIKPLSYAIKAVAGHRGAFHSPLFLGLLLILLKLLVGHLVDVDMLIPIMKFVILMIPIIICLPYIKSKGIILLIASVALFLSSWTSMDALNGYDFYQYLWMGIGLGMASHLLMDALTVSGIPLLWPFSKKKFRLLSLKTGQHEGIAQVLFILPTLAIVLWYFAAPVATALTSFSF